MFNIGLLINIKNSDMVNNLYIVVNDLLNTYIGIAEKYKHKAVNVVCHGVCFTAQIFVLHKFSLDFVIL